ncbi:HEAT repeat domain-containing protein [Phormidium sp. CLA17]|uniref:HEAT repeat domain-containing protein n=1 Tax=Leptolyngbya sp. Cla-17 TaxID=2803751 RepID=UPI0014927FC8|nr:HEAT repeat domain-containing protein [Leptolyngbya sp. Cla-17]MBM0741268.1 HEAT repeat domain-containing protein [Leptolyngbya sp. Cla-17]
MNAIWLSLMIYAVVEAIAAAYRVRQKRRTDSLTRSSDSRFRSSRRSLGQSASTAAIQLDSDLDRLFHPSSNQSPSELLTLPTPPAALELPLAVSLSVNEVVNPETRPNSTDLFDLNLGESNVPVDAETMKPNSPEHQSVLAEISQLDHADSENAIAAFQRHLNHPDDIIRAAIVFEFGETVARYHGAKAAEAKEILMQLSQDPNPTIRTQVAIALAKIEPIVL